MRPEGLTGSEFQVNGLAKTFTYLPTRGPLAGWRIVGKYDVVDARFVMTEFSILTGDGEFPQNGITGTLLKEIKPASLLGKVRASEQRWLEWLEAGLTDAEQSGAEHSPRKVRRLVDEARDLTTAPRSGPTGLRGRPPLDNAFLRKISREHVSEISERGNHGSVHRLADSYGVPYNTVKGWIKKAKDRGLYGPMSEQE